MAKKTSKVKIIPLGGLEEIGKNLTLFEFKDEILILDCGVAFPDDDLFGIDLVIPDMTYLHKNRDKIKEKGGRFYAASAKTSSFEAR